MEKKNVFKGIDILGEINNIIFNKFNDKDKIENVLLKISTSLNLSELFLFSRDEYYHLNACWLKEENIAIHNDLKKEDLNLESNFESDLNTDVFIPHEHIFKGKPLFKTLANGKNYKCIPITYDKINLGFFIIQSSNLLEMDSLEIHLIKAVAKSLGLYLHQNYHQDVISDLSKIYQNVLNHLPFPISILDCNQKYIFFNEVARNDARNGDWLIGKNNFDFVKALNLPLTIAENRKILFDKVVLEQKSSSIEEEIKDTDGSVITVVRWMIPIFENNTLLHIINYTIDISDLKIEKNTQNKKLLALQYASIGISLLDTEGKYYFINQYHAEIFGYQPKELIGKSWTTLYDHQELARISEDIFPKLLANGNWTGETEGLKKDGKTMTQNITLTNFDDGTMACITRDITAISQELQSVKLIKNQLELAINATDLGMLTFLINEGIITYNNDLLNPLGYTRQDIPILTRDIFLSLFHPEDREKALNSVTTYLNENQTSIAEKPFKIECRLLHKNGNYIWVLGVGKLLADNPNQKKMIGFMLDISLLKEAEIELKNALYKEKELNELKSSFTTITSHEFRTPLTNIKLAVEILKNLIVIKENSEKIIDKVNNKLEGILIDVDRMTDIMENVLTLGKIEANKLTVNKSNIEFNNYLVNTFFAETNFNLTERQLVLNLIEEDCIFCFDQKLMNQILTNLIQNAIKYSKPNGQIFIRSKQNDKYVIIEIEDEGIGMNDEDLKNIYQSFYRSKNVDHLPGTGLGTYIVKLFVEIMGGEIEIESKLNEGTKVKLTFSKV